MLKGRLEIITERQFNTFLQIQNQHHLFKFSGEMVLVLLC